MNLDVSLEVTKPVEVYSANITHNLNKMASAADLYIPLWRPHELFVATARSGYQMLNKAIIAIIALFLFLLGALCGIHAQSYLYRQQCHCENGIDIRCFAQ